MTTWIDVDLIDDEHDKRHDFRRANGAPLVSDPNNPDKTLRYSRPSGFAKPLDDEHALTNWRISKAMDGVARSEALRAQVIACRDDDREEKNRLREVALDKGQANERSDLGTGLHAMTVRAEDSSDVDFDPGVHGPDLEAYLLCLRSYGLASEMIEVPLVNDEYRAAGTADRIFRLTRTLIAPDGEPVEAGTLIVGDIKTGAKLDFSMPGHCVQVALYAAGQLYDVVSERRLPTPPISQDWAVLIHLPVGRARAELLWSSVPLGLYGAWLSFEVKKWQASWKRGDHDMPTVSLPPPIEEVIEREFPDSQVVSHDDLLPAMLAYCGDRLRVIGGHDAARAFLLSNWPDGLRSPKQGISDPSDVVRLLDFLDVVEKQFSIPFLGTDPRSQFQPLHRKEVNRSNDFMLIQ
jgi:hypothetical protein